MAGANWDGFYKTMRKAGASIVRGVIFTQDGESRAAWRDIGERGEFLRISNKTEVALFDSIEVAARANGIETYLTDYSTAATALGPELG